MNLLASEQNQGIAKGLGVGMVAVLMAYGLFYGWISMNGPAALKEREGKLVSSTVIINRVLPMAKPPVVAQIPSTTETPHVATTDEHAAPVDAHAEPVAEAPHEEPAKVAEAAHDEHHEAPPAAEKTPAEHVEETHAESAPKVEEKPAEQPKAAEPLTAQEKLDSQLSGVKRYANGMYVAPVDGLYEDTAVGRLPVIGKGDLTAFKAYKKPFALSGNAPVISIAVSDMGLSQKITESAIKSLPPEITLIVSPYADGPDMWASEARSNGHEVWLSLPMETKDYPRADSGPYTMLVGAPERENLQKLDQVMSRAVGYTGLVVGYQPIFMDAQNDVRPILGEIYKRGVGLIANGGVGSLPDTMALSMNAPYSSIDVWIDKPENTSTMINASLQQLEVIAREKGFAAGIISPSSVGFRELQVWLETLQAKGIVLAPLSAQTGY
jgi:polysaccharide deacetylase 2 family uncharacterized protein YibQ